MDILDRADLAAAAGVDPWGHAALLATGDPQAIASLAAACYRAGGHLAEAAASASLARRYARAGYTCAVAPVIDDTAEATRAALRSGEDELPRVAGLLDEVAATLGEARRGVDREAETLDLRLAALDAGLADLMGTGGHHLGPVEVAAWRVDARRTAVVAVREAGTRTTRVVTEYETLLAQAARSMAALGYVAPAALHEAPERATSMPPAGASPRAVAGWWAGLDAAAREYVITHGWQVLGGLAGVPVVIRDMANRRALAAHEHDLRRALARLAGTPGTDPVEVARLRARLASDDGLLRELAAAPVADDVPTYLVSFDPTAPGDVTGASISYGDPDTADDTAVVVSGMGSKVARIGDPGVHGRSVYSAMTGNRAVVVWLNGPEPAGLGAAATDSYAADSAPRLSVDLAGLRQSHRSASAADGHLTVIGFSYGTYITGKALALGARADDVVFLGSPGVGVNHAADLGVAPGHVWSGQSQDDPIIAASRRFTPDPLTGNNPADSAFGARHLDVHGSHGHSQYFEPGSAALANVGRVASGDYPQVHTVPAPGPGPLELVPDGVRLVMDPYYTQRTVTQDLLDHDPFGAVQDEVGGQVGMAGDAVTFGRDGLAAATDVVSVSVNDAGALAGLLGG